MVDSASPGPVAVADGCRVDSRPRTAARRARPAWARCCSLLAIAGEELDARMPVTHGYDSGDAPGRGPGLRRSRCCGREAVVGLSATALSATITLDPDMEIAPTSGRSTNPTGSNTPAAIGGRASCSRLPRRGSGHLAQRAAADRDGRRDVERVGAHQDDVGGLNRHVGAGADRNPDVRLRECGRVVDAVAHHGDLAALGLQLAATFAALSAGSTSAITSSMPTSRATRSASRGCHRTASRADAERPSVPRSPRRQSRAVRPRSR